MALLQDILGTLEGMGFNWGGQAGGNYMGSSEISPSQIASTLRGYYDLGDEALPSHMFEGISSDILKSGLASTYAPQVRAGGQSLLADLQKSTYGKVGKQAAGGFAGSGQQGMFTQQAKDVYGKGMADVLGDVAQQRTQGIKGIQDVINEWRETALRIKG